MFRLVSRSPAPSVRRSLWTTLASRALSSSVSSNATAAAHRPRVGEKATEKKQRQLMKEFEALPAALDDFAKSAGHTVVPRHFPIPVKNHVVKLPSKKFHVYGLVSDVNAIAWRDEERGMNLGRRLESFLRNDEYQQKLPDVMTKLEDRGFQRGETLSENKWRRQTMPALRVFFELHGHSMVPQHFQVPRDDSRWPDATKGLPLGRIVGGVRKKQATLTPLELADLERIGFAFDGFETRWSERVLPSLEAYVQVHGDCCVPSEFVVPSSEPWSRKAWGRKLGRTVAKIRSSGHFSEQVARDADRMEALGFVWDFDEFQWSKRVLPSLELYYELYGDSRVPTSFVVPSEAPWPKEGWGLQLGWTVSSIRTRRTYDTQVTRDADRLEALNFARDRSERQWTEVILPSLEVYAEQYGDCRMPQSFVVPSQAPWPQEAWGLKLGAAVHRIRSKTVYLEQVKRDAGHLEAIGFAWDVRQGRWDKLILPALETFFQIYGHSDVPHAFVVPSEVQWPRQTWGLALGTTCYNIRYQGSYAKQRENRTQSVSQRSTSS